MNKLRSSGKLFFFSLLAGLSQMNGSLWAMGAPPADPNAPKPPLYVTMAPMIVMVVIFYFLLIRPQSKQRKEKQRLIESVKNGDKILLSSGIYATVVNVMPGNDVVTVKISDDVKIKVQRSAITEILKDQSESVLTNGAPS